MDVVKQRRETVRTLGKFVGQTFGRLTVQELIVIGGKTRFVCECTCGRVIRTRPSALRASKRPTRSCGCLQKEVVSLHGFKHGQSRRGRQTTESRIWALMKNRCINSKLAGWKNYGGRGITVCEHWQHSFEQFFADMGPKPTGKSLDRRNNDLGYLCPKCHPPNGNCRWATRKEQAENRRKDAYPEIARKNVATWVARPEEYKTAWAVHMSVVRRAAVLRNQACLAEALLGGD